MQGGDGVHQPIEEPVLLMRCAAQAAPDLNSYLEGGGFVGAATAADLSPLEVITTLRQAALRGHGRWGQPTFLKWFAFSQGQGPGHLGVDARQDDPRGLTNQALIHGNPFGLLEGLAIAALALGTSQARVLLPPGARASREFLRAALAQYRSHRPLDEQTPALELEFIEDPRQGPASSGRHLWHCLETWHQVTLVFILGLRRFLAQGMNGQGGTRLVTVGGAVAKPGLVEVPMGAHLWQVLEAAGGLSAPASFQGLSLDQGLSGFLPLEAAATPLAPEEMISAGVNPGFTTLWALGEGLCPVQLTRQALYQDAIKAAPAGAGQALALVEELRAGRAPADSLERLRGLWRELKHRDSPAAWPLGSSLMHFLPHWQAHLAGACPLCATSAGAPQRL